MNYPPARRTSEAARFDKRARRAEKKTGWTGIRLWIRENGDYVKITVPPGGVRWRTFQRDTEGWEQLTIYYHWDHRLQSVIRGVGWYAKDCDGTYREGGYSQCPREQLQSHPVEVPDANPLFL